MPDPGDERTSGRRLIAGVGHRFWSDLSVGPVWHDRLAALDWPDDVAVEDFGFGAIAMTQRLGDERFRQAVFVAGEERGRPPGTLRLAPYEPAEIAPELVQAYVTEAGAGVIALDPLLEIARHFGVLPEETWLLEVEPVQSGWGEAMSPVMEALYPEALRLLRSFAEGASLEPTEILHDA